MDHTTKHADANVGDAHSNGGSCCGGADAKAKAQTTPAEKTTATGNSAAKPAGKPAGSSGCCCG